jgi:hypothetical protein
VRVKHFANHDLELEVIWQSPFGPIPQGGIPAVATDCVEPPCSGHPVPFTCSRHYGLMNEREFYAGEIIGDELYAVDMLPSESDARRNAERRDWRQR